MNPRRTGRSDKKWGDDDRGDEPGLLRLRKLGVKRHRGGEKEKEKKVNSSSLSKVPRAPSHPPHLRPRPPKSPRSKSADSSPGVSSDVGFIKLSNLW